MNIKNLRISEFKLSSLEELKILFVDVFSSSPWFDQWDDEEQLDKYLNELIGNSNSLSLVFIDNNDKIIGASLGYVFSWWQGSEYFIKEFFISNDIQGSGAGSLFLEHIEEYLVNKNIKGLWLLTESDFPAYDFYKKNKFKAHKNTVLLSKSLEG